jgi:hypothetical protein
VASPGDLVDASTVKDLVVGSGIAFDDGVEHFLKEIAETWRLFTVTTRHG